MRALLLATLVFIFGGAALADSQHVSPLSPEDERRLDEQRAVVTRFLAGEDSRRKFETAAGKLGTLEALLEGQVFSAEQTYELQSLGIVLGDAFTQELGAQWVIVEDAYRRDPALRIEGTSVLLFPLTMISKRVERGEQLDVFELFNGVAAEVHRLLEGEQEH